MVWALPSFRRLNKFFGLKKETIILFLSGGQELHAWASLSFQRVLVSIEQSSPILARGGGGALVGGWR